MAKGIIIGGKTYPIGAAAMPIPVLNWTDHGLQFRAGEGHNKVRKQDVRKCIWHWTGGEGSPEQVWRTLSKRKLGVSLCIGTTAIYQFADPMDIALAAAGRHNQTSVNVEIVCYGFRRAKRLWTIPRKGRNRIKNVLRIHGRNITVADFTPYQYTMAHHLADVLSEALDIPRLVPPTKHQTVLPFAHDWDGHIGHLELTRKKCDPGPLFMTRLGAHLANNPTRRP